jgi:colanic acid/amylovoran biosynthesis glycosyltransferase
MTADKPKKKQLILNFHGVGAVPDGIDSAERHFWCNENLFTSVLDYIQTLRTQDLIQLTFDDGNMSDAVVALPALIDRGLTASFFICAARIGLPRYLDCSAIKDLVAAGMQIGSHGWSHVDWRRVDDKALDVEVDEARKRIADVVGHDIDKVAIPFGSYDRRVLRRIRRSKSDIKVVYTSDRGFAPLTGWLLPRESYNAAWDNRTLIRMLYSPLPPKIRIRRTVGRFIRRWRFAPKLANIAPQGDRVAYFTSVYPAVPHTFIRREINALEALGITVLRYSLASDKNIVDQKDIKEMKLTSSVLNSGIDEVTRSAMSTFLRRPLAAGQTIYEAVRLGWSSDRGVLRHLMYVLEASVLTNWMLRDGVQHFHAHFGTNPAAIAMLISRLSGIPYSFTVHGPEEFDKWAFIGLAEKIRHCEFVAAVSSYGRSQLYRCVEREYWNKIQVIHCGLDFDSFPASGSTFTGARRLVCVGRLSAQKGQVVLLEAARRLASEGEDFELVLAGDGEMRSEIETLISRYNLQTRVRITGWIDGQQVRHEILEARGLVLPSLAEGLPVVIMEVMALRRPVISTFIAGIPELVRSGEHGWLVPASDVEALADAMRACLTAPMEELIRMGEAARLRVLLRHNIDKEAGMLVKLFKASIEKSLVERERVRHNL